MRILLGVHQFLPDFYAGTEILTLNTARELCNRGHEVRVFAGYADGGRNPVASYFDHYEHEGIPVDRYFYTRDDPLVSRNVVAAAYNNPRSADGFERSVSTFSPDIAHFYHLQRLSGSVIDVCFSKKIPVVFTATDYWLVCPLHQLYLPDESHCNGPDNPPVNCLKHLCQVSSSNILKKTTPHVPDAFLKLLMRRMHGENGGAGKMLGSVRALMNRKDYLLHLVEHMGRIMVATRFMGDTLVKWGVDPSKIVHLPFAVEGADGGLSKPDAGRIEDRSFGKETSLSPEKGSRSPVSGIAHLKPRGSGLRVGYIGTLYNYKGAHILLAAINRVPQEKSIAIDIYGDMNQFPSYVRELRNLAGNDRRIRFCGTFQPEQIGTVLGKLDVLVVPSLWHENTPLVVHEALGAGVPVIGSNVSGVNEVIRHGINGLLFERGDDASLSSILIELYENRKMIKTLAENCRPVMSMKRYVDRLEQIYSNAIQC